MTNSILEPALLAGLRRFDTPTICNALEIVVPERRGFGYTTGAMVCAAPTLPPMVGYARTATFQARAPSSLSPDDQRASRIAYYE